MKNNQNIMIISFLFIGIILVIFCIYFNKNSLLKQNMEERNEIFIEEDTSKVKNIVDKNIDVDSPIIKTLLSIPYTTNIAYGNKYLGILYDSDIVYAKDFDDNLKLAISFNLLHEDGNNTFSKENMSNKMKSIFGKNVNYIDNDIEGICSFIEYKENVYSLVAEGCGAENLYEYRTKPISAFKYDDKIEVIEKVAYIEFEMNNIDGEKKKAIIYSANDENNKIAEVDYHDNIDLTPYVDKLDSYKYTFLKEDNNYYFYSVEKL